MFWYATASLTPAVLLALACLYGGPVALLAVLSITVLVFFMDKLGRHLPQPQSDGRVLCLLLALVHFPLLALGVWALSTQAGHSLTDKLLIFTGLGLYVGQVSNSNAHELIHASARLPRRLGAAVYVSLLHGHHVSAHLKVHHIHAATDKDPNSARAGESFWAYALRATGGEFSAGLRAETALRKGPTPKGGRSIHPYVFYILGGTAALIAALLLAGIKGLLIYLAIALYAQMQLLLSDYVQHYGLRRHLQPNGKPEPMGPEHSWNAPKWYSSAMMLNAPRHSDHHIRPARPFTNLEITPQTMPLLPQSLPVMAVIALVPPLWHRVMDKRAARWQKTAQPTGSPTAFLQD